MLFRFPFLQVDPFLSETTTTTTSTSTTIVNSAVPNNMMNPGFGDMSRNPLVDPSNFNFMELLQTSVAYAFLLVFALSVVFVFWGGITFILSGGQEEKVKNAVNTIRYAIIGFLVAIFSFAIIAWLGRQFDLDLIKYIKPDNLFDTIKKIFK